ncbi:hypothetical protein ACSQ67_002165 [Phaseolus vulgaris]
MAYGAPDGDGQPARVAPRPSEQLLSLSFYLSYSHRLENLSPPIPFQWHCPLPQKPFISSYERSSLSLSPPSTV